MALRSKRAPQFTEVFRCQATQQDIQVRPLYCQRPRHAPHIDRTEDEDISPNASMMMAGGFGEDVPGTDTPEETQTATNQHPS